MTTAAATLDRAYGLRVVDRAARTALQSFLGYLLAASTIGGVNWNTAGLAVVLTVVTSLLQGLVDLPSVHRFGLAGEIVGRALRTFAQTALGSVGAAVLVTDVPWDTVLSAAALAGLVSLVTSLIATPIGPKGTAEVIDRRDATPFA